LYIAILQYIRNIVNENAELFTALGFFIGLGLGHWLALGRDKRREFNDAALPIREWLFRQIKNPSPMCRSPKDIEIDTFVQYLPAWKRKNFMNAYEKQQQKSDKAIYRDSVGGVLYSEVDPIIEALRECLPFTERM
jgi:hypothetical protein